MRALGNASRRLALAVAGVLATACVDATSNADADASADTGTQTGDTTESTTESTAGLDPCPVCEPWEECIAGACALLPGHCAADDDCTAGQLCAATHECDDACNVLRCPEHAQCIAAECTCDDGFFANAGKCVDRVLFALPMDNTDAEFIGEVVGFDNDPRPGQSDLDCVSYDGEPFPRCYDDHEGTDFILLGGFTTMDNGSAAVFAAADGEVVFVHDGEYDRCALDLQSQAVRCEDGGPVTPANAVTVLHADGVSTSYFHLKKNSILVAQGDRVICGQPLALVGSSGNSSAPHLHFEVIDAGGNSVDAYAGRFSHPETYWAEQDGTNDLPGAACQ